jgi:hypothetical protein
MNDKIHDILDGFRIGKLFNANFIILIESTFEIDVIRLDIVLETEQSAIHMQLSELEHILLTGLEIKHSKKFLLGIETDKVGGPETILAVIEHYFRTHVISKTIIDELVDGLVVARHLSAHPIRKLSECVKLCATFLHEIGIEDILEVLIVIVEPDMMTGTQICVLTLKVSMLIKRECHDDS